MVRVISEETFNDVVQENIDEFDMTREEAVADALKQFEAQGVDLSNILKVVASDTLSPLEKEPIDYSFAKLELYGLQTFFNPLILDEMIFLKTICEKSLSHRTYVAKKDLLGVSLELLEKDTEDMKSKIPIFEALVAMTVDQPEMFNQIALMFIIKLMSEEIDPELLSVILKWIRLCCIKHEENRHEFVSNGLVSILKGILEANLQDPSIVRDVCGVFRALVLDDDVRVEFGHALDHARVIADESLTTLTELLKRYECDKDVVGELLLTLCALVVRNEYCEKVIEAGEGHGLKYIRSVLVNFPDSEKLNRQCMKILKVLAGNDNVKSKIGKAGIIPRIICSMTRHKRSAELVAAANGCIAALALRSPSNSQEFGKCGAPAAILDGMRDHPLNLSVQKQGCWSIRNIVSRNRELCPMFLEKGAEKLLNYVLEALREECEYDAKSALRDLGCAVTLREEWTGKGGALN